jgi:hypothetical protein
MLASIDKGNLLYAQIQQNPDCTQLTPSLTFGWQNRHSVGQPTVSRISKLTRMHTRIA